MLRPTVQPLLSTPPRPRGIRPSRIKTAVIGYEGDIGPILHRQQRRPATDPAGGARGLFSL